MNEEIRMVMADNEMPFAILPHEMLGLDPFPPEHAVQPDVVAKIHELNTVLANDNLVVVPSVLSEVYGMLILKLDVELDDTQIELVRMFCSPLSSVLNAYGADAVSKLLPDQDKV